MTGDTLPELYHKVAYPASTSMFGKPVAGEAVLDPHHRGGGGFLLLLLKADLAADWRFLKSRIFSKLI
jgi:hypothetical protein